MAAPEFVPTRPLDVVREYLSPPRYDDPWLTDRPAEVMSGAGQPGVDAGRMGAPGPDQGYLLKLVPLLRDELRLTEREARADVEAGCVAIGLKRASLFRRAPVLADLRVAYVIWGYLDPQAPADLVAERRDRFEGVHLHGHHYPELRAVVDAVPASTLRGLPAAVEETYAADWRSQLVL